MKSSQATVDVFLTAFRSLSKSQRNYFFLLLLRDQRLRLDLIDLAIAAERRREPARPFRQFLTAQKKAA